MFRSPFVEAYAKGMLSAFPTAVQGRPGEVPLNIDHAVQRGERKPVRVEQASPKGHVRVTPAFRNPGSN
ncbi:hypothetical protein OHQ89_45320 [Streptomyces canus]|uniref:hypothetical protein n=1 Tax=Streptomyces canus TaxID=58343 RepID=UPI0030E4ABA0